MSVAIPSSIQIRLRGGIAVALLALGAIANAQTTLQGKVSTRPLTRDDISAYKLPATLQTTGGLMTIGVGQPAYLEALVANSVKPEDIAGVAWTITRKPSKSNAALEESPLGAGVPTYEPSDQSAFIVAGRRLLRPDVPGAYFLRATVSTKAGAKLDLPFLITAGTYVGGDTCNICHTGGGMVPWNMGSSVAKTAHPHLFQEGIDGVASDHYSGSCIACHVVGYDTNAAAKNNGFDDRMAAAGWTVPATANQKAGTFDALPKELKDLGGIQCENCHGPGSQHAQGGNPLLISISYDSGVCSQCHAALTHHSKSGQFKNSAHANAPRETEAGCVGCHTGIGFMDRMNGVTTPDLTYSAINCQTCHEPHGQTIPGTNAHLVRTQQTVKLVNGVEINEGGTGMLCMNCHMSRRNGKTYAETTAGSNRFGPHHGPQADMLAGTNGYTYGATIATTSPHLSKVENSCAGCHMQMTADTDPMLTEVGGHTFRVSAKAADGTAKDMTGACRTCHPSMGSSFALATADYDGDGTVEPVQTEVQHLLNQLALLLPQIGKEKSTLTIDATWTRPQLKAAYNYLFVQEDKSLGVHNTQYAVALLKASIADLKAQK